MALFLFFRYLHIIILYLLQDEETKKCIRADFGQLGIGSLEVAFRSNSGFRSLFYARTQGGLFWHICTKIDGPYRQIEIFPNDGIGKGMVVYHSMGCVVNAQRIGEYCYIYQGVTVGKGKTTALGNKPVIGNNVRICTNAVVIGGISIGDNVTVGAGAFVNDNIPANAVVGGIPAKVLYYKE